MGKQIQYQTDKATKLRKNDGRVVGYVHGLEPKSVVIQMTDIQLNFIYEERRFLLQASNKYRNRTRGMCGDMDGENYNELITANNCYALQVEDFIASYALKNAPARLDSNRCIPILQQRRIMPLQLSDASTPSAFSRSRSSSSSESSENSSRRSNSHSSSSHSSSAEDSHSLPRSASNSHSSSSNSHSNSSSSSSSSSSSRSSRHSSSSESNESILPTQSGLLGNTLRPKPLQKASMARLTRVARREQDVCFSIQPLPMCLDNHRAADIKVQLEQFACLPDSPASEHYLKMIKKGVNPDLSRKKNLVRLEVKIPTRCLMN